MFSEPSSGTVEGYDPFDYGPVKSSDVEYSDGRTVIKAEVDADAGQIDADAVMFENGEAYVKNRIRAADQEDVRKIFDKNGALDLYQKYGVDAIDHLDEIDAPSADNIRGSLAEVAVQPRIARKTYGDGSVDLEEGSFTEGYLADEEIPFEMEPNEPGFDGMAIDRDGNLVIIETKAVDSNARVTRSSANLRKSGQRPDQMSEEWIGNTFEQLATKANKAGEGSDKYKLMKLLAEKDYIDITEKGGRISIDRVNMENIETELTVLQDGSISGKLVSSSLRNAESDVTTIDRVNVLKTGDVFGIERESGLPRVETPLESHASIHSTPQLGLTRSTG
jgi:hypothetical protein